MEWVWWPLQFKHRASQVALVVKNPPPNAGDIRNTSSIPGWEDPLEKEKATYPSILTEKIPMDRKAWWAIVFGVEKSQTQLSDSTRELLLSLHPKMQCAAAPVGRQVQRQRVQGITAHLENSSYFLSGRLYHSVSRVK